MYTGLHVKYPLPLSYFYTMTIFPPDFRKNPQITNFKKIRRVGDNLFHADGRMDRQASGQADVTKPIVALHNFANVRSKRRKANWIRHMLRRNSLLNHVTKGKIYGVRIRKRRRDQVLDDLKENKRYWNLKEEAVGRTVWRTRFGRSYRPVLRQTTE